MVMTKRQKKKYLKEHGIFDSDSWLCTLDDLYIVGPELRNKISCRTKKECIAECIKRYDYYSSYRNDDNEELKQKLQDIEWSSCGLYFPPMPYHIPAPPRKSKTETLNTKNKDGG